MAQWYRICQPMQETQESSVQSLGWEDPLEEGMATHSSILVFLPGEFHGQRSLAGYSPWGCKESDVTEQLTLDFQYCAGHLGGCKEVKGMLSSSKE